MALSLHQTGPGSIPGTIAGLLNTVRSGPKYRAKSQSLSNAPKLKTKVKDDKCVFKAQAE